MARYKITQGRTVGTLFFHTYDEAIDYAEAQLGALRGHVLCREEDIGFHWRATATPLDATAPTRIYEVTR